MARRAIVVRGIIQGVGFRPFIYHLAIRLDLAGFVKNQTGSVLIEIEGAPDRLDDFLTQLTSTCPPLARIEEIHWEACPSLGESIFQILPSEEDHGPILISPDVATCAACLRELFDPADRRYLYPFLNCTYCGPRLTIIRGAPYDRERTTMAAFPMCPACQAEYENPADRRFHAQPIACPRCGPQVELWDSQGKCLTGNDPLGEAIGLLRRGQIGAIKGLGGYHLACDARREETVAALRSRKHREEKPFAVMVADLPAAHGMCEISELEKELLLSPSRPIVLLRKKKSYALGESVSPGNPYLGLMLPYTPLHHLLFHYLKEMPLVMTSGNRSDDPIAYRDEDAAKRLAGIADFFLSNNRPIHIRCDDSVTRVMCGQEAPLRRSRGMAPAPLRLPVECARPILALGGQQKSTFGLGRGRHAILSHHLGDLDHLEAFRAYQEAIRHYENLFDFQPEVIVHDLHPDYASTRYAQERLAVKKVLAVQHHHSHLASCMAEHDLNEPVLGVIFDGTGYGLDGTIWGGEFLVGDYGGFHRAAHLRPVVMPGGEKAIRQPWRMALAFLLDADEDIDWYLQHVGVSQINAILQMITRRVNSPLTSSAGRLFDAVAAFAGIRSEVSFEGQPAMELEWRAMESACPEKYPFGIQHLDSNNPEKNSLVVDTRPVIRAVVREVKSGGSVSDIARRFHTTLVEMIVHVCGLLRDQTGINKVVCSGGVFMNSVLTEGVAGRLEQEGFRLFLHRQVPANDGGLSLGQLAIAACAVKKQ